MIAGYRQFQVTKFSWNLRHGSNRHLSTNSDTETFSHFVSAALAFWLWFNAAHCLSPLQCRLRFSIYPYLKAIGDCHLSPWHSFCERARLSRQRSWSREIEAVFQAELASDVARRSTELMVSELLTWMILRHSGQIEGRTFASLTTPSTDLALHHRSHGEPQAHQAEALSPHRADPVLQ